MVVYKKRTLERKTCKCEFLNSWSLAGVRYSWCGKRNVSLWEMSISLGLYLLLCFATTWFSILSKVSRETLCPLVIRSSRFTTVCRSPFSLCVHSIFYESVVPDIDILQTCRQRRPTCILLLTPLVSWQLQHPQLRCFPNMCGIYIIETSLLPRSVTKQPGKTITIVSFVKY